MPVPPRDTVARHRHRSVSQPESLKNDRGVHQRDASVETQSAKVASPEQSSALSPCGPSYPDNLGWFQTTASCFHRSPYAEALIEPLMMAFVSSQRRLRRHARKSRYADTSQRALSVGMHCAVRASVPRFPMISGKYTLGSFARIERFTRPLINAKFAISLISLLSYPALARTALGKMWWYSM